MNLENQARLALVREKIREACQRSGREEREVTLIGAGKTKPWPELAAFAELGLKDFGENYVQEALEKQKAAAAAGMGQLRWHLIGTLQSNKAKFVAGKFSLFHALDSFSLAQRLDKAAAAENVIQHCLLEVNIDQEASKGGLAESSLARFLEQLAPLKNILVTGLTCIPAPHPGRDPRVPFQALRQLRDRANESSSYRAPLKELSMGMSADFQAAIEEGATFVRVGTTLFGEREKRR